MPISLRIPPKKEELINRAAQKAGKTKTGFILDAVDENCGWLRTANKPSERCRLAESERSLPIERRPDDIRKNR